MIITFYSYKGGVGRSMALANVAELLYQAGLKVLMVDWDVEAPGLERYFAQDAALEQIIDRPGIIDLLLQYKAYMTKSPVGAKNAEDTHVDDGSFFESEPLTSYLVDLYSDVETTGCLWLLPAGRRSRAHFAAYSNAVLTFDWHDFYVNWEGELFFEGLRQEFESIADVVLIDSRTGVTEMGGICTYQLADKVVMFCAANSQSIDGTEKMAQSLTQTDVQTLRRGRPLEIIVVPSRIEDRSEITFLNEFRDEFVLKFAHFASDERGEIPDLFWDLRIPHIPYYAFTELVAVRQTGKARAEAMVEAFAALAKLLVLNDVHLVREHSRELRMALNERLLQARTHDSQDTDVASEVLDAFDSWTLAGMQGLPPINLSDAEIRSVLSQLRRSLPRATEGTDDVTKRDDIRRAARSAHASGEVNLAHELWRQLLVIAPDDLEAQRELQQRAQDASAETIRRKLNELRRMARSEIFSDLNIALIIAGELLESATLDEETRQQVERLQEAAIRKRSELTAKAGEIETLAAVGSLKEAISRLENFISTGRFEVMDRDGQIVSTSSKLREYNIEYAALCTQKSLEYLQRAEKSLPAYPKAAYQLLEQALSQFDRADPDVRADLERRRTELAELIPRWQKAQDLLAEAVAQVDPKSRLSLLNEAIAIYPGIPNSDTLLNDAKRDVAALHVRSVRTRLMRANHFRSEGNLRLALNEVNKAEHEARSVRGANPELDVELERVDQMIQEIEASLSIDPLIQKAQLRVDEFLERRDYSAAARVVNQLPLELVSLPSVQQLRRRVGRIDLTRPALVVGLGGTGQSILTNLKASLLELGRGVLPSNVALLAFDTMPQAAAEAGIQERERAIASARLEENKEFIFLGGDTFRLAQAIRDGRHPEMSSWFQAEHYLRSLPPAAFNLSEGAGTARQFGRLAIFQDLARPATSRIVASIHSALQSIRPLIEDQRSLEIIVVGSLAGGTGSGLFIDLAFLLRSYLYDLSLPSSLRGIFLLPRAFPMAHDRRLPEALARAFAAWRELNRFQTQSLADDRSNVVYSAHRSPFGVPPSGIAFDACYLIEGASDSPASSSGYSRDTEVLVSVANTIMSLLDQRSGTAITESISEKLISSLARNPEKPLYGGMGSFTARIPIGYIREDFAHQLALGALERIACPVLDDQGQIRAVRPNANSEDTGTTGADTVFFFMERPSLSRAGEDTVYNALFLPKIAELMKADAENRPDMHEQWAAISLGARQGASSTSWLNLFSQLGDSLEAASLRREIDRVLNVSLMQGVPPSRLAKDKPIEAIARLNHQIPNFRLEHVGVRDATGGTASRGAFGEVLVQCKGFQIDLFQQMLRLWLLNTLDGQVEDPLTARSGKLGYAESFLSELVEVFDRFLTFMRRVALVRDQTGIANHLAADVDFKRQAYTRRANQKRLTDLITRGDYDAQEAYLIAEQHAILLRQEEILHETVVETAQAMLGITRQCRDQMRAWVSNLIVDKQGVLVRLKDGVDYLRMVNTRSNESSNAQQIIGDISIRINDEQLRKVLNELHWAVRIGKEGLRIDLVIGGAEQQNSPRNVVHIAQAMLRQASIYFPSEYNATATQEMLRLFESDVQRMAEHIRQRSSPHVRLLHGRRYPTQRSRFLCVQRSPDSIVSTAFQELTQSLQSEEPGTETRLMDSEDPYRFTVISAEEMIPAQDFSAWEECEAAYLELLHDEPGLATTLHVFPAEVAAAKYERKLNDLQRSRSILHPRVVNLLEHEERLQQFLLAWTYGFIRKQQDSRSRSQYYVLTLENATIWLSDPTSKFDVFGAIVQFLIRGTDVRRDTHIRIDYQLLQELIQSEQSRLGAEKVRKLLSIQSREGFVAEQRELAERIASTNSDQSQCYRDLADLAELMLADMYEADF